MGVTLTKTKSGDFYVNCRQAGKRKSFKVGRVDRRTAMKAVREKRKELALGLIEWNGAKKRIPMFRISAKEFIQDYAKRTLKASTWQGYKNLINRYLIPAWHNKPLESITKQDVKKLLLKCQGNGLNINNLRICCSSLFQWAVDNDVLKTNPARGLGRTFRNGTASKKTYMQVLNSKEVNKFLKTVKAEAPEHYDFCLTLFRTGMRLGEMLGLDWADINFDTRKITVQRAFVHGDWTTPKSGRVRHIDMSPELHKALWERKGKGTGKKIGEGEDELNLVFQTKTGEPMDSRGFRRNVFQPLLAKCGLPKLRLHDCRHTFASLLLMNNASVIYVSKMLGHSNITTTLNTYAHYIPAENSHDVSMLDA